MANGRQQPIAPVRKVIAAVLGPVAAFVTLFGLGMTSWSIVALGVALLILTVALVAVRGGGGRAWVNGVATVHSASEPPTAYAFGRCELQIVIDAPGLPPRSKKIIEPRVPVAKWPIAGQALPIKVAIDDQRHVRILWDDVPTHAEAEANRPPEFDGVDPMADDILIEQDAPPWAKRRPDDDFPVPPPGEPPTDDLTDDVRGLREEPLVMRHTPGGTIVLEGTVVEPPARAPLPRRPQPAPPRPAPAPTATDFRARGPEATDPGATTAAGADETADVTGTADRDRGGGTTGTAPSGRSTAEAAETADGADLDYPEDGEVPGRGAMYAGPAPEAAGYPEEPRMAPAPRVHPHDDIDIDIDGPGFVGSAAAGSAAGEPNAHDETALRPDVDAGEPESGIDDDLLAELIDAPPAEPSNPSTGPIHGVGITVLVTDLDRSVAFYRDMLGFFEIDGGEGNAVLASGATRLVLRAIPDVAPINRRLVHLNLEVQDVETAYQELKAKGVRFTYAPRAVNRGVKLELWAAAFRDPDGHGIALTQWRERVPG